MDNEMNLAKQFEGNNIALNAIAESLQKMNSFLAKQDAAAAAADEEEKKKEDEQLDKAAYDALVKSVVQDVQKSFDVESLKKGIVQEISKSITQLVKQDAPMADLNTDKSKKVGGTNWPMSSNRAEPDKEQTADGKNPTESAQQTIEAAVKNVSKQYAAPQYSAPAAVPMEKKEEPMVEDVEEEEEVGAEEFPMEEDDGGDLKAMVKALQTQVANLTKERNTIMKSMDTQVRKEVDGKLSKLGFREERGLGKPKLISKNVLGADDKKLIKSEESPEDLQKKLQGMSWSGLLALRDKVLEDQASGQTLPKELLR